MAMCSLSMSVNIYERLQYLKTPWMAFKGVLLCLMGEFVTVISLSLPELLRFTGYRTVEKEGKSLALSREIYIATPVVSC